MEGDGVGSLPAYFLDCPRQVETKVLTSGTHPPTPICPGSSPGSGSVVPGVTSGRVPGRVDVPVVPSHYGGWGGPSPTWGYSLVSETAHKYGMRVCAYLSVPETLHFFSHLVSPVVYLNFCVSLDTTVPTVGASTAVCRGFPCTREAPSLDSGTSDWTTVSRRRLRFSPRVPGPQVESDGATSEPERRWRRCLLLTDGGRHPDFFRALGGDTHPVL